MTQEEIYQDILQSNDKARRFLRRTTETEENDPIRYQERTNFMKSLSGEEQAVRLQLMEEVSKIAINIEQPLTFMAGFVSACISFLIMAIGISKTDNNGTRFHFENLLSFSWFTYVIIVALMILSFIFFYVRSKKVKQFKTDYPDRIERIRNNATLQGIIKKASEFRTIEDYGL